MQNIAVAARFVLLCAVVRMLCGGSANAETERTYESVSLVALIATPEKYDKHYVLVHGIAYFDTEHAINALYLTREDKDAYNGKNATFLFLSPSLKNVRALNSKFVVLRGQFQANINGHLDSFSSSISDVDVISAVKKRGP